MLHSTTPMTVASSILYTGSTAAYDKAKAATTANILDRKRQENEVDLISECARVMTESGLGQKIDIFLSNHTIADAKDLDPIAQRFLLNQYWRLQLMTASVSSTNERFNLLDSGEPNDWLRMFAQFVIPFLVEQDLPKVI